MIPAAKDTVNLALALGLGVLVLAAVYLTLGRVFSFKDPNVRKAAGLFAGSAGLVTTLFLYDNPDVLYDKSEYIVLALIGLVVALIATLRRSL
jgi:hypothetical protein